MWLHVAVGRTPELDAKYVHICIENTADAAKAFFLHFYHLI